MAAPRAPVVVVHGGAGQLAPELRDVADTGIRAAASAGMAVLEGGGDAVDAAVEAVRVLEDDPTFNAGHGACMTRAGTYEMDAAIMRARPGASDLASGAVASVPDCRDPIVLARAVMDNSEHCLLAGEGALQFAHALGVGTFGRDKVHSLKAQRMHDRARAGDKMMSGRADTVGAVVFDAKGTFCAAGSTGGVLGKHPGRVGDTPLLGSGLYARTDLGAAAATGVGEAIMTHVACYELLQRLRGRNDPAVIAFELCDEIRHARGQGMGVIAVLPDGRVALGHATEHMSWAVARPGELHGGIVVPRPTA